MGKRDKASVFKLRCGALYINASTQSEEVGSSVDDDVHIQVRFGET